MLKYFEKAKNHYLCNTSYPLNKNNFSKYKSKNFLKFDEEKLCLYVHIPFCTKLCSFCEYVKFKKENNNYEKKYLDVLEKDINNFINSHNFLLYGFDIGGGTPTCLELDNFKRLMSIAKKINNMNKIDDFEPSIEATFDTLTKEKIDLIVDAGFKRISLGIQTTNTKILTSQNRNVVTLKKMIDVFKMIKGAGISKINVDFMYGIINQKEEDIIESLHCLEILKPEHVTLYEMRYNMIEKKENIPKSLLFSEYEIIYNKLMELGYFGRFSQNTFSLYKNDYGLSSYLRYRMIHNISYKGFGISAQSKNKYGISYNIGKNHENFLECIKYGSFIESDTYLLPKEELVAKYVMISLYYGKFSLHIISDILEEDAYSYYKEEFDYLISEKYIEIINNDCFLTKKGFYYYGAIGSMFYSSNVKKWFMEV